MEFIAYAVAEEAKEVRFKGDSKWSGKLLNPRKLLILADLFLSFFFIPFDEETKSMVSNCVGLRQR